MADRDADEIKRDIEQSRAALAEAVDEIAFRTNPKRVTDNAKQSMINKVKTPQGQIVIGVSAALIALLIVKRVRKH